VRRKTNRRVTPEVRREVMRLSGQGLTYAEILVRVDVSQGSAMRILRPLGGVFRRDGLEVTGRRLTMEERVEIRVGLEMGRSLRAIAAGLGRAASTVTREVKANGGPSGYRPVDSHRRADRAARRPKVTKLAANPGLCARVVQGLEQLWSPEQIARGLRAEFGAGSVDAVSHETIYKSLYVQGRGELRRELTRCLRTGRAVRKQRGRLETRGQIAGMINISERPAEADDRAVPGHWEGDLIVGKNGRSHIATLVERSTRYVMLAKLSDATAETVTAALVERVAALPEQLWRSLTWDQGREMAGHAAFSVATDVPVFFCDPHSPWQRGSNENTNGLLRQYFPKGTDLSVHDQAELDRVAIQLNGRPRLTLGDQTPAQRLAVLLEPQAA
jgi:IS30 family transposase